MAEIKPCPFCGKMAKAYRAYDCWYVKCLQSNLCLVEPKTRFFERRADAVEAWNKRVGEQMKGETK